VPETTQNLSQALVSLIRLSLHTAEESDVLSEVSLHTEQQWEQLFVLSSRHNVASLVSEAISYLLQQGEDRLPKLSLPLQYRWAVMQQRTVERYEIRTDIARRLSALYAQDNLQVVFLKGLSLSSYYPHPEWRDFSDLDIYLFRLCDGHPVPAWVEGDECVKSRLGIQVHRDTYHHTTFDYEGVHIENHFDLISQHIMYRGRSYERLLKETLLKDLVSVPALGVNAWYASPTFQALFLIRHLAIHFTREHVSLRQLLDWMFFLQHEGNRVEWESVLRQYRTYGLLPFVEVLSSLMERHFGYHCPYITASNSSSDISRVWKEIISSRSYSNRYQKYVSSRWKHALCSNTPWMFDMSCLAMSKVRKIVTS